MRLRRSNNLPATDVCPHVAAYRFPVRCALGGPLGVSHLVPASTIPDSLCARLRLLLRVNGLHQLSLIVGHYSRIHAFAQDFFGISTVRGSNVHLG